MTSQMRSRPAPHRLRTGRSQKLLAASLSTLALAGCKSDWRIQAPHRRIDAGRSVAAPSDHRLAEPATHHVRVGPRLARASSPPARSVAGFLEHFRATDAGNSRLVVAVPSGSPNEVSAMHAVGEMRRHDRRPRLRRERRSPSRPTPRARRRRADPRVLPALRRRAARVRRLVDQPRRLTPRTCPIRTSAAPSSATSPSRSPTRPTCSGRAPDARAMPERRVSRDGTSMKGEPTGAQERPREQSSRHPKRTNPRS